MLLILIWSKNHLEGLQMDQHLELCPVSLPDFHSYVQEGFRRDGRADVNGGNGCNCCS